MVKYLYVYKHINIFFIKRNKYEKNFISDFFKIVLKNDG